MSLSSSAHYLMEGAGAGASRRGCLTILVALGIVALFSTSCIRGGFASKEPATDGAADILSDMAYDAREEASLDLRADAAQDALRDAPFDIVFDHALDRAIPVDQLSWQRTTFSLTVDAKANIYASGHATPPGGGLMPPVVKLPSGAKRFFRLTKVTGTIAYFSGNDHGPDGQPNGGEIVQGLSYGGLAGTKERVGRFLSGVFVGTSEPADPAPASLDIGDGTFQELQAALRQIFFAGDGLDGATPAARQVFWIPSGATRLFFGFMDSSSSGGTVPSSYADNTGSLHVEGEILVIMNGGG